ncbi:MAG: cyclodeaminase/cyclohydrolase family protein [Syntrophaceae bacterium]|nr:cyclodeaminase/cyclohydrolase family protein [Syntrophaceae bacterium]
MSPEDQKDDVSLSQFLDAVAGATATPGGGSVSALAGALAAALVEMVVNLTAGKKGFEAQAAEMEKLGAEAHSYREALGSTIAQDINAYQGVMKAYLLPKSTESEKETRKEEIQKALRRAADPPLFTAATSLKVLKLCQKAAEKGNPNAITDAAVGALLAEAALQGGVLNVLINLSALKDENTVKKMMQELERLEAEGIKTREKILNLVKGRLKAG